MWGEVKGWCSSLFQLISQMGNSQYHQLMEVIVSGPGAIKPLHRGTEEEFAEEGSEGPHQAAAM